MKSEAKVIQFNQARAALEEFIKILVKEYPLIFMDGSCGLKIEHSTQYPLFPYEVSLEIRRKE
jgi:hypothetical protein